MRLIVFILSLLICIFTWPTIGHAQPNVSGNNAVLMEQSSGRVLYDRHAHQQQPIASITKIMTAIIAIESGKLDDEATASKRAVYTEGSSIYLEQGETMLMKDLVYGLMLRSGNDAAVTISEHIGGSVEGFVHLMNEKAAWIGMDNTHFENPHGLHSDNHYSTAYDMAILMRYAMENDLFQKVSSTESYTAESRVYAWKNKNKLLTSYYQYCTGGKTGFTKKAGRTLVSTAHKNNMNLIAVTLNAPDDWNDHINMYEWAFDTYTMEQLEDEGDSDNNEILKRESALYPLSSEDEVKVTEQTVTIQSDDSQMAVGEKKIFHLNGEVIWESNVTEQQKNKSGFLSYFQTAFKAMMRMDFNG
ncbi:D-alanyl-D-alanine carboxypeptidase family protein [Lentibacillus saliphilus]|uniref:D-alanyl-D-alanine carboxypeptidase family protein n=1 Tax=Lentibacillus saliphilus TaxID=2737028 RepID=UPI001C30FE9B|nr:D-alanyl-D-alanine carboxypeptidase family protein [Lentibacillus saliphilus]